MAKPKGKEEAIEEVETTEMVTAEAVDIVEPGEATDRPDKPVKTKSEKLTKTAKPAGERVMHGKKWRQANEKVESDRLYPLAEAVEMAKATSTTKFDGTVELHAKTTNKSLRGMVNLPHGTGKEKRVVIFAAPEADELIAKVEGGWTDFDVAIATPAVMPKLAKLAKTLGPKGLMPSPKSGTVSETPDKVAEELKGGRVEYRVDKGGALHQAVGKVSWPAEKLVENIEALLKALPLPQIISLSLNTTMGPSVKLEKPSQR